MWEARFYFSQDGEDLQILALLNELSNGYYLDIGCNYPIHFSNTFKLYLLGWQGVLVDGNPTIIQKTGRIRKQDICVNALVSNQNREMDFYVSESHLISSIDPVHAGSGGEGQGKSEKLLMQTITLDQIIERYVPPGKQIDLLSIDVEGHDFEVLQSITLSKTRPRLIVIEDLAQVKNKMGENRYVKYLQERDYLLVSTDRLNLYFMRKEEFETKN